MDLFVLQGKHCIRKPLWVRIIMIRKRIKTVTWEIIINQNITHTGLQAHTDAHTFTQHTHKVYLFSIVLATLLNSWPLTGAWGRLCVGGLRASATLCPPSVSSIPLVSLSPSLIKQETCSPNNLPPRSPGTTSAFHQHHCFSLLPPHVLLHHGNSHTHTPSLLPVPSVDRPAMCLFTRVPAATPLYVDGTWCCPFVWGSGLSYLPLTPGSLRTITGVLVATGYPHWAVIDELINGQCECVCAHLCLLSIPSPQAHWSFPFFK